MKWILVTDRLPTVEKQVLAVDKRDCAYVAVFDSEYNAWYCKPSWGNATWLNICPTHWMPLPSLPQRC